MICAYCKIDKDVSEFYPDAINLSGPWCCECIKTNRKKRKKSYKKLASSHKLDQLNILTVINQFQPDKEPYLYLLECNNKYKIGYSTNLEQRFKAFNTASPLPHKIIAVAPGGKQQETTLHNVFNKYRGYGEWFSKEQDILNLFAMLKEVKIFLPGYVSESNSCSPSCVDGQSD